MSGLVQPKVMLEAAVHGLDSGAGLHFRIDLLKGRIFHDQIQVRAS